MLPRLLPLLAGLLPFTAMCGAFLIGLAAGTLPACNPFLDGCVSISATGRKPPGSFLFKAIMLPYSLVLVFFWYYAALWLRAVDTEPRRATVLSILISGFVGAVAVAVYVTFLGTKEPVYEFMRRTGIYFGFVGTGLGQLFLSAATLRIANRRPRLSLTPLARTLVGLSVSLFGLGVLNLVMKSILEDPDPTENRIEWLAALGLQMHFILTYLAWRRTKFSASVSVG